MAGREISRPVHVVSTSALDIAYEQTGLESGEAILLLHGFPYDVRSYDQVRDGLAASGKRLIIPYLRGFGATQYRSAEALRSGQQAALAKDAIDLLDALQIESAVLVGYDWGGRAACAAAALWPERVQALVAIGGYTIQNIAKSATTPEPPAQIHRTWYQWYFQTEQGRTGLEQDRERFCKLCWQLWSPTWRLDEALFASTAKSFHNPDFVSTVIHSYRHRYGNAAGDPAFDSLERQLAEQPKIAVPTVVLHGADDGVTLPTTSEGQEAQFTSHYERQVLPGVGHGVPQEAPGEVIRAIQSLL